MAVPILLGISVLSFYLGILAPGDPAEFMLDQNGIYSPSEEQIEELQRIMGLNRPVWIQYFDWLSHVLQGDLGTSYISGRNIGADIALRLPATIELAVLALFWAGTGGIFLGTLCAVYKEGFFDQFLKNLTNAMLAIPSFWLALIMILIFSEMLKLLPTSGSEGFLNFIMPSIVLSFATMGTVCRFMRGAMLQEFSKSYFITARIRGLTKWKLIVYYALPNAIIPVVALLGNYFASVLGGSVIAESIFAIPGISSMALDAIRYRDYPVLQAYVLVSGWILVMVMTAVDILISYLNPRIHWGKSE